MTLPAGFKVGHWTDPIAMTGCTVILCEGGAAGGVHMGGGAPASIQTDIIGPASATGILHGVLLTGGSAFGLAAYAGVMKFLEEKGVGVTVLEWRVPLVAGAAIFDLMIGDGKVRPDANAAAFRFRLLPRDLSPRCAATVRCAPATGSPTTTHAASPSGSPALRRSTSPPGRPRSTRTSAGSGC